MDEELANVRGFDGTSLSDRKKVFNFLRFVLPPSFRTTWPHVCKVLQSHWFSKALKDGWTDVDGLISMVSCIFELWPWQLAWQMMPSVLCSLTLSRDGTARHEDVREKINTGVLRPCFGLVEIGGQLKTRARYDKKEGVFVLESTSPKYLIDPESDCAIVYAKLIGDDGSDNGVWPFFIHLRDAEGRVVSGVRFGCFAQQSAGTKVMDGSSVTFPPAPLNGWVMFYDLRVKREALLNRWCDVDARGNVRIDDTYAKKLAHGLVAEDTLKIMNVLFSCAASAALGMGVRASTKFSMERVVGRDGSLAVEDGQRQRILMLAHARLFGIDLLRTYLRKNVATIPAPIVSACTSVACRIANKELSDLRLVVGSVGLLGPNGFPELVYIMDSFATLSDEPSMHRLTRIVVAGYHNRYDGFTGAFRYLRKRVQIFYAKNPISTRRTNPLYLRSVEFQRSCLLFRLFVLTMRLVEDLGRNPSRKTWLACSSLVTQVAEAFVTIIQFRQFLAAEATLQDSRARQIVSRCRSLSVLSIFAGSWASFFLQEGFFGTSQSASIDAEVSVLIKEALCDVDVLVATSRDPRLDVLLTIPLGLHNFEDKLLSKL